MESNDANKNSTKSEYMKNSALTPSCDEEKSSLSIDNTIAESKDMMDWLAKGQTLMKADGTTHNAETSLADKDLVLFFFGAHWAPPCRQITHTLKDFYVKASAAGLEIIFISSDKSAKDMKAYMETMHGDWFGVSWDSDLANFLKVTYDVVKIPTLIVVKKDGTLITRDGLSNIMSMSPQEAVDDWRK